MLRHRLGRRGLSRETQITFSTISLWLTGKTEPNAVNIEILARFFDVDRRYIYELLGRAEPIRTTDLTPDEELLISRCRQFSKSDKRKHLNMLCPRSQLMLTDRHNRTLATAVRRAPEVNHCAY
jgi:transcriptional regulator with XRE-family HTH domain